MNDRSSKPDSQWHLDKRIPVALILSILGGYAGGVWKLADFSQRLTTVETQQQRNIVRIDKVDDLKDEIIQMKEQLRGFERVIIRLETYLDRGRKEADSAGAPQ